MPTVKIADIQRPCRNPEHYPPSHAFFPDGVYEHTCPGCGKKMQFTVCRPTLSFSHTFGTKVVL